MIFAIDHDFFAYGSSCKKMKNGKYRAHVEGEDYDYTLHQLAEEFDTIDDLDKKNIIDYYYEKELKTFRFQTTNS